MNLHQLRVFHAAATAGSVSDAARRLRVSQPAVSKQLGELEATLGIRLFDRLPRGVRLTEGGKRLLDYATRIFSLADEAEHAMEQFREVYGATLRVGASTTIGSYLVPGVFGTLKLREPAALLSLEIDNTQGILERVREEAVDVGLTEGLATGEEFDTEPFAEDELIPIAAPTDPLALESHLTLERILSRPILAREKGSGSREVLENALEARGFSLEPSLDLGSTEALKNAAKSRLGVAFVSSLAVDRELSSGLLVRLHPRDFELRRKLSLVTLRHKTKSPLVRTFEEILHTPRGRHRPREYAI